MDIENLFREKVARYIQPEEAISSIHTIKINRLSIGSIWKRLALEGFQYIYGPILNLNPLSYMTI